MASAFAQQSPSSERATCSSTKQAPELVRRHALAKLIRDDGSIDWSPWYLSEEEDMGQSGEQGQLIDMLRSSIQVLAEEREWSSTLIATDNFFAWVEGEPLVQVSPDVYLLDYPALSRPALSRSDAGPESGPGETPGETATRSRPLASRMLEQPLPRRWESWRPEHDVPRLAVEIVSSDWKKDYEINPERYDHLGVRELVLVDPEAFVRDLSRTGRSPLVIYRRNAQDRLERVYRGHGPAHCVEIEAYLCFQTSPAGAPRVRLSRDAAGTDIVCTAWEKVMVAEDTAAAAVEKAAAAVEKAAAAEQKATTQAAELATKDAKLATQAAELATKDAELATKDAELAALRARLRDIDRS